jgi:ribosomal subunit interface protein
MIKNIKATNIELTTAITDHINDRLNVINKFLNDNDAIVQIEVGRTTNHHNKGDIFRAEFNIKSKEKNFYSESSKHDLYLAINDAKDQIINELKSKKGRSSTLFNRGARSIKKMLKGISKRNPFTSKY